MYPVYVPKIYRRFRLCHSDLLRNIPKDQFRRRKIDLSRKESAVDLISKRNLAAYVCVSLNNEISFTWVFVQRKLVTWIFSFVFLLCAFLYLWIFRLDGSTRSRHFFDTMDYMQFYWFISPSSESQFLKRFAVFNSLKQFECW